MIKEELNQLSKHIAIYIDPNRANSIPWNSIKL